MRRCTWVVAAQVVLWASGCVLVGYQSTSDAGPAPLAEASVDASVADAAIASDADAAMETRDATLDATLDASLDAAFDSTVIEYDATLGPEDASFPCATDGGCACPPNGSACAGDLWLSCNAQGTISSTTNCRDLTNGCNQGVCVDGVGCKTQPASDGTACDDGAFCTAIDTCAGGVCKGSGSPCVDNICLAQTCNEQLGMCMVDTIYANKACGTGFACNAQGVCAASNNCVGTCTPKCEGQATCGLSCHDATSCNTSCGDGQTCNVDCAKTGTCTTTCSGFYADCNLGCKSSTSCTGTCINGDCSLDCQATGTCKNSCSGAFSECATNCNNSNDCSSSCEFGADCQVSNCANGNCSTYCADGSSCGVDCNGAKSCNATCERGSNCELDCRGAGSCSVSCSLFSQCYLRCTPNQPNCRFSSCFGGATKCADGSWACHMNCP